MTLNRMFCFFLSVTLPSLPLPSPAAAGSYTVSWIGNSFGGAEKWVQQDIEDICVARDGTVYAVVPWDEAGGEVMVYRDGDVAAVARHTHGWGYHGGLAIAVNDKYVFFGQQVENEGGHLVDPNTWPPKGTNWYGIARRRRADIRRATPFEGAKGGKGDTLAGGFAVVHEVPINRAADISGLWATATRLYAGCPYDDTIRIFDAGTMEWLGSWSMRRPGRMCMDSVGRLWVVQKAGAGEPAGVLCFAADGRLLPQHITFSSGVVPYDVCVDTHRGYDRLFVTDVGSAQRVLIYRDLNGSPQPDGFFGVRQGIYAPPSGRFRELHFNSPVGVATDAEGNVYVASSAGSAREAGGGGGSTVLESYAADARLNWRLLGLEFIDCADLDPSDGSPLDVFTKEEHFLFQLGRSGPMSWTYCGYTVDKFAYPDDPRLHIWSAGAWVRRIEDRRFLFVNDMNAQFLQVFCCEASDGAEIARPAGFFAKSHVKVEGWPPYQPEHGEWIWRDRNGNGTFDRHEYDSRVDHAPSAQGWWVDRQGNVWLATETEGIRKFPFQGLDDKGNPVWDYATMVRFDKPEQLDRVKRLRYDSDMDTMYLGGVTSEHKNQHWKPMGPVICRFDDWSKPSRTLRWKIIAPYQHGSSGHASCEPMGFDVAGEYLFVPYTGRSEDLGFEMGHVEILATDSGRRVDAMEPSPEVGEIGLQDIRECLTAHRLSNGQYLVFLEDDFKAKVVVYRWRP